MVNVVSPLSGLLAVVYVDDGDLVEAGDDLFEVECMKAFSRIKAPIGGVCKVVSSIGAIISEDEVIIEITPLDDDNPLIDMRKAGA